MALLGTLLYDIRINVRTFVGQSFRVGESRRDEPHPARLPPEDLDPLANR